jgi:uncharacterized membrane protein
MKESRRRSVLKALSWRITGSLATTMIVFLFTGKLALSIGIGVSEGIAKTFWFYMHERLWDHIQWGRLTHPLAALPVIKELAPHDFESVRRRLQDLGYL